MKLVIAEKPSVAVTITKVIGARTEKEDINREIKNRMNY